MEPIRNGNICDYLDFYLKLSSPHFAVLLTGNWGVGKTHFVKKYIKKSTYKDKSVYVSLYGIDNYDDIAMEIFKQIHPILASKELAVAGRIGRGLMHAVLQVDLFEQPLDTDKKTDIAIPEYLKQTDHLLVFDDIERCAIPVNKVMGYINQFVEHQNYKVILVGNEEEINEENEDEGSSKRYTRIKEKLIGKTFLVESDAQDALGVFIEALENDPVKELCEGAMDKLLSTYTESTHRNLRLFRQALLDFDRFFGKLSDKVLSKQSLIEHLLELFMIISPEVKSGNISASELTDFSSSIVLNRIGHEKDFDEMPYGKLLTTYTTKSLYDILMEGDMWAQIVAHSKLNKTKINQALEASNYFADSDQPAWIKLWHYFNSTDEEFGENLVIVTEGFSKKEFRELGVIKHVCGMLLKFSSVGLYKKSNLSILTKGKELIDNLAEEGELGHICDYDEQLDGESWGGLAFIGRELPEFRALLEYTQEKRKEAIEERYPETAKQLLKLLKEDADKFRDAITLNSRNTESYFNVPIIKYMTVDDFVKAYIELSPDDMRTILYAFQRRYSRANCDKVLREELDWLKQVIQQLENHSQALNQESILRYQIKRILIPQMESLAKELESEE